jgi:hypothetical protein
MSEPLSSRISAGSPWVIEQVKKLETEIENLRSQNELLKQKNETLLARKEMVDVVISSLGLTDATVKELWLNNERLWNSEGNTLDDTAKATPYNYRQ